MRNGPVERARSIVLPLDIGRLVAPVTDVSHGRSVRIRPHERSHRVDVVPSGPRPEDVIGVREDIRALAAHCCLDLLTNLEGRSQEVGSMDVGGETESGHHHQRRRHCTPPGINLVPDDSHLGTASSGPSASVTVRAARGTLARCGDRAPSRTVTARGSLSEATVARSPLRLLFLTRGARTSPVLPFPMLRSEPWRSRLGALALLAHVPSRERQRSVAALDREGWSAANPGVAGDASVTATPITVLAKASGHIRAEIIDQVDAARSASTRVERILLAGEPPAVVSSSSSWLMADESQITTAGTRQPRPS